MSYSPTLGRWVQQDPAGYIDGLNLYEDELSNPTTFLDPSGLATTQPTSQPTTQPDMLTVIGYYRSNLQDDMRNNFFPPLGTRVGEISAMAGYSALGSGNGTLQLGFQIRMLPEAGKAINASFKQDFSRWGNTGWFLVDKKYALAGLRDQPSDLGDNQGRTAYANLPTGEKDQMHGSNPIITGRGVIWAIQTGGGAQTVVKQRSHFNGKKFIGKSGVVLVWEYAWSYSLKQCAGGYELDKAPTWEFKLVYDYLDDKGNYRQPYDIGDAFDVDNWRSINGGLRSGSIGGSVGPLGL